MDLTRGLQMKMIISILLFLLHINTSLASFDHSHRQWTAVVSKVVVQHKNSSLVNYKALKANPQMLDQYLKNLSAVTAIEYAKFSTQQKLAFLINAYNAFTIKLIVENYPVRSIRNIGIIFYGPWKKKFISLFQENISLDHLEHNLIAKNFPDPRVHFALVCASKGCPALSSEAYSYDKLETQLESATNLFITDSNRNRFVKDKNLLEISPIFKWYKNDFAGTSGSVKNFISTRITTELSEQQAIRSSNMKITYLEYDWSLNDLN